MPDIGFDRADGALAFIHPIMGEGIRQRVNFNRVAQLGPRAVRFDITKRVRVKLEMPVNVQQQSRLRRAAGRG